MKKNSYREEELKIEVIWQTSDLGKVCTAIASTEDGRLLGIQSIVLLNNVDTELYKILGQLGDAEIEKAARSEVMFKLNNPDLFQINKGKHDENKG